ncbi:hypothetical protein J2T57_001403 [Natronocella acetinitrilica]|uniref:HepT-like domain-containing protein n=2 Tax=Natronocella acetinitrilica TaxID=414046 RepID=A0AAE3KB68_9GAMM|nr:hypothetical protein [Natronocella acetinitrilica]MCP1674301.1 hypothetical protein [Natronocella acetinitrilica]
MARENPGVRPALLGPASFERWDALRGFRHRARHQYTNTLDMERLLELSDLASQAVRSLHRETTALASALDWLGEADPDDPDNVPGG